MAKSLNRILLNTSPDHPDDLLDVDAARAAWTQVRTDLGFRSTPTLLAAAGNAKIARNEVPTYTLTLSPASTSQVVNVCDKSTPECRKACVMWTAGRGSMLSVRRGRDARTIFAAEHPVEFLALLTHEVRTLESRGTHFGLRLNVGSDIVWEKVAPWLFDGKWVRAYDYTKWSHRERDPRPNYHLTYSHNERWDDDMVHWYTNRGLNVAMVFDAPKHALPETWQGIRVIDGDVSDYRYRDPLGVIVGLAAKGAAQTMNPGGFVTSA